MGVKQTRLSNPLQLGTGKYEVRIASLVVALLSSRGPFMENNTSNNEADDIFVNKDSYKKKLDHFFAVVLFHWKKRFVGVFPLRSVRLFRVRKDHGSRLLSKNKRRL